MAPLLDGSGALHSTGLQDMYESFDSDETVVSFYTPSIHPALAGALSQFNLTALSTVNFETIRQEQGLIPGDRVVFFSHFTATRLVNGFHTVG